MNNQPSFKGEVLALQKEYEKALKEKHLMALEQNNQQVSQANLLNEEGFIEFPKEKGSAPTKEAPALSLGLDHKGDPKETLPLSLKEKHNVHLKKKQRNRNQKKDHLEEEEFNEKFKKIKTNLEEAKKARKIENKYEVLGESSEDEEGQTRRTKTQKAFQSKFCLLTQTKKLEFWEKNSHIQTEDPLQRVLQKEGNVTKNKPKTKKANFVSIYFYLFIKLF